MYQPLEQFVINYNLSFFYNWIFFFFNKHLLTAFFMFIIFFYFILYTNNSINTFFMNVINTLMNELLNVTTFLFSFVFLIYLSVFTLIITFNVLGLLPFTSCWTTQFFANLTISFTLIVGLTLMNLDKNGVDFFSLFIPQGVPSLLLAPLFLLELFSYFIRILSLSIRLFSNMVAGHSLLHILFEMSLNIHSFLEHFITFFVFISAFVFVMVVIIFFFEIIVAFLQAYVFSIMFIIYCNDLKLTH